MRAVRLPSLARANRRKDKHVLSPRTIQHSFGKRYVTDVYVTDANAVSTRMQMRGDASGWSIAQSWKFGCLSPEPAQPN